MFKKIILIFFLTVFCSPVSSIDIDRAVDSLSNYGVEIQVTRCVQKNNRIDCDLFVTSRHTDDTDFALSSYHLLIDQNGNQYKSNESWLAGRKVSRGGGNGIILVPNIRVPGKISFSKIIGRARFASRIYIDWGKSSCTSRTSRCPALRFGSLGIN